MILIFVVINNIYITKLILIQLSFLVKNIVF